MSEPRYPDLAGVLREARALVERGWTQHTMARDRWSHKVCASDPRACRFCASGAVLRAAGGDDVRYLGATGLLQEVTPNGHVVWWNDAKDRTKADVLRLFDAAIRLAETP